MTPLSVHNLDGGVTKSSPEEFATVCSLSLTAMFEATPPDTTKVLMSGARASAHSHAR